MEREPDGPAWAWHRVRALASERRDWITFACVAAAYVTAAKFGINLSVAHGVITPVWAPSGISLAALLVLGPRFWPAVAVGAFVSNLTSDASLLVAGGIAVGNTLEAVTGAYLLRRARLHISLDRVRDVLALVVLGALASTTLAATNGVTVLYLADGASGSYGSNWLLWWFGDAVGMLMVTPLLLVLFTHRDARPSARRLLEGALLLASLCAVSAVVFLAGAWRYPYLIFPLLLWAALRFRQLGAATSAFVVGAVGTWGTVAGTVPIAETSPTTRVQIIQALVGVLAISLLVVGATLAERATANRTLQLTAARLGEAQALTHIGSWEWDVATDRVIWSDELYRIFGLRPQSLDVTYGSFLERVHADDREHVEQAVRRASTDHQPFSFEHRVVLPDGVTRLVLGRGRVVLDEDGRLVRMAGTAQDITEQRQAESVRDDILSTVSHELRTPLTSVLGFSATLQQRRESLSDEVVARMIDQVAAQARRLDRLLSDLLDVDRLRHGLIVPVRRPTDIARLVAGVADVHRADGHAIAVRAQPATANVDGASLERIVDNLVSNAVKHTPPGTPIVLRVERRDDDLLIAVDDEGPGVPDEFKSAIFEIFNRGALIRSVRPGTGIGLSLAARFASLHGGRLWVEDNERGTGASFRVLLPGCLLAETSETPSG